jgi:hypothetical protein
MVQGSDSMPEFIAECKAACMKNCGEGSCKKAGQRMRIYCSYVDKHFHWLKDEYRFWGGQGYNNQKIMGPYKRGKAYSVVFLIKKIH